VSDELRIPCCVTPSDILDVGCESFADCEDPIETVYLNAGNASVIYLDAPSARQLYDFIGRWLRRPYVTGEDIHPPIDEERR